MWRLLVGVALAIVTISSGRAIPPDFPSGVAFPVTGPTPPKVLTLIEQLGSDNYRTREEAGQSLLALGDRTLPSLRAALKTTTDPEAYRRIEVLVQKLEAQRLTSPCRVTLKVKDREIREIVADIAKQTGYPLQYNGGANQKLTLDLTDAPFWEVVDKISSTAGLSVYQNNEETGQLIFSFSDTFDPHVSYWGPFRVVASHVGSNRNLQLAGLSRRQPNFRQPEYLNLNFSLFAEPKAPVLSLGQPAVTRAVDETGASMLLPPQPGDQSVSYYSPMMGLRSFNQGFAVSLTRANAKATTIKELQGKVPAVILAETRPEITVQGLLAAKKKRVAGRTAELEVVSATFANDVLALEVTVRRRQGDPDDYNWLNSLPQRLEVTDATGAKYTSNGVNNQTVGPNVVTYQMQYATNGKKLGKPARLALVEWITVTREVAFTFKDIPLP